MMKLTFRTQLHDPVIYIRTDCSEKASLKTKKWSSKIDKRWVVMARILYIDYIFRHGHLNKEINK